MRHYLIESGIIEGDAPELTGKIDAAFARNPHSARAVRFGIPIFV
jgi:hypothetical protein